MDWLDLIAAALECDWPIGLPFLPREHGSGSSGLILLRLNEPAVHPNEKSELFLNQGSPSGMVLETQRLVLRQLTLKDTDGLLPVLGDPEAMIYYPHPFSRDEVESFIDKQITRYAETGHGLWAVILKSTGEVIGDCGLALQDVEDRKEIEVGYHLRRDHWHNGYATEAARACIRHGFYKLRARQVICMIRPENRPSRRVAERNNMTMGRLVFWHGFNHLIYSISRAEWFETFRRKRESVQRRAEDDEKDLLTYL